MKKLFATTALIAALTVMFCLSPAAQAQQIYMGIAQDGAAPVGTEEPCILNSCLFVRRGF